jgi:hypothetical protein
MSAAGEAGAAPEPGLFIIWSDARDQERRILAAIHERFNLRRVLRVTWSPGLVDENFARFYRGQVAPPFSSVFSDQKGRGPFTLALVEDPSPRYEKRATTRGTAVVNANMLDAKQQFRAWTGGGMRVHGTDTAAEAVRDTLLLLGDTPAACLADAPAAWDDTFEHIERDLSGALGWASLRELFLVLTHAVTYVVLRNFENLPDDFQLGPHADVDLLTDDYGELIRLTNARPVLGGVPRWGGRFHVRINGSNVIFDLRFVGDGYYDPRWARRILDDRRLIRSAVLVPSEPDYFESLAYHAVVHKREVADDYRDRLAVMAAALGHDDWDRTALDDDRWLVARIQSIVGERGYTFTRPRDVTVFFNYGNVGADHALIRRKAAGLRRELQRHVMRLSAPVGRATRTVRQRLITRAPWLRHLRGSVMRAVRGGTRTIAGWRWVS